MSHPACSARARRSALLFGPVTALALGAAALGVGVGPLWAGGEPKPGCDPQPGAAKPEEPKPGQPLPSEPRPGAPKAGEPKPGAPKPGEAPPAGGYDLGHMHNVHAITPRFLRGSQPETESDLAELAKLGVKVVVSVDGAKPMVAAARKHGLRYVHVPMGYNGISREKEVLLYKVFSTLEGPFYVHCHHGKHRGPAACAVGLVGVEGWTPEQVVAEMKRAGTAAKYEGLFAMPAAFVKPTAEELAAAPSEFPEVSEVPGFQAGMVEVDHGWERLGQVRKAAWSAPPDHPDVSPKHEATIFAELFRELARRDDMQGAAEAFRKHMGDSEAAAWDLAKALEAQPVDAARAEAAYKRIEASCIDCHKAFRDNAPAKH